MSSEKNQRVLHKLLRAWQTELSRPAAPLFAASAEAVGRLSPAEQAAVASAATAASTAAIAATAKADGSAAPKTGDLLSPAPVHSAALPSSNELERQAEQLEAEAAAAAADADASAWEGHAAALLVQAAASAAALGAAAADTQYLSRLVPLSARLAGVLGSSLADGREQRSAGAALLHSLASEVKQRAFALRLDPKATRPMKKKALTDLLHALADMGISPLRSSVPAAERDPAAWFMLPRVDASSALSQAGSPWGAAPALEAWAKADENYFRNQAHLQALWAVNNGVFHRDISPREAMVARHSCEHLLHLQRRQRAVLSAASRAASLLGAGALAAAAMSDVEQLPPTAEARAWLWHCRSALDEAAKIAEEETLLLKALLHAETAPAQQGTLPIAVAECSLILDALTAARTRLTALCFTPVLLEPGALVLPDPACHPPLVLPVMVKQLRAALAVGHIHAARLAAACPGAALPGIPQLAASLRGLAALEVEQELLEARWAAAQSQPQQASPSFLAEVDSALSEALLWAQTLKEASTCPVPAADDIAEVPKATLPVWAASLERQLGNPRLLSLGSRVDALRITVAALTDACDPAAASSAAAVAVLAAPLQMLSAAAARIAADYTTLHAATVRLGGTLTALFCSLARDGFCAAPGEEKECDDEGGRMMDDQAGTGMGAGEGKRDVSDEIEDEGQVLGMEDMKKQDGGPEDPNDPAKGIEMGQDFEGDKHDLEHDEEDDAEPPPETDADQLDKQARITRRATMRDGNLTVVMITDSLKSSERNLMAESKGLSS